MEEIWKDIVGFEGYYQVSNLGNVRSLDRTIHYKDGRSRNFYGKLLNPTNDGHGYRYVALCKAGKSSRGYVHHLVLTAFVGLRPDNDHVCRHFPDKDTGNNRFDNLRWGSYLENSADRRVHKTVNKGSRNGQAKLTDDDVKAIRSRQNESQFSLAKEFGVCNTTIYLITTERTWK